MKEKLRHHGSEPGVDDGRVLAGAFRIEFSNKVSGPVILGYGAHFGLGLFVSIDDERKL